MPTTTIDLSDSLRSYHSAQLSPGYSPDNYITTLEDLRTKLLLLGSEISERDFMIKILNSLGEDYANASHMLMHRIGNNNDGLTIEIIQEDINTYAQRLKLVRGRYKPRNLESALIGATYSNSSNTYKARCSNCGKRGHKGADCRKRENNNKYNNKNKKLQDHASTVELRDTGRQIAEN